MSKESGDGEILIKRDHTRGKGMIQYSKAKNRCMGVNGIIKEMEKEPYDTQTK